MSMLLACDEFLEKLLNQGELIPVVAIVFGCTVGMVAIIASAATGAVKHRNVEKTRRELAAYVAEGSLDPDKAIALMRAGSFKDDLDSLIGRKT
jgi:hypothetical protein